MLHRINIIAAVSENGAIGRNGSMPWHIPSDLRRFKRLTTEDGCGGNLVIIGRRTYESIPGKKLPGRRVVVLTKGGGMDTPDVCFAASLQEALRRPSERYRIFIAGGSEVYREGLRVATCMLITRVHAHVEGDAFFPEFGIEWCLASTPVRERHPGDEFDTSFEEWVRA